MAKRKKHEEHEEHVNHERWLITYADMITLLMVLFIVLFSMSQVDIAKYEKLKMSLSSAFGGGGASSPIPGGDGVLSSGTSPIPMPGIAAAQKAEQEALQHTKEQLGTALEKVGLAGGVGMRVERRGLVVTIASDKVLFEAGRATLTPEGKHLIHELAGPLGTMPNPLRVEGHTDDVPIAGFFPSNWELSTARATTVLRELMDRGGIAPSRLSASGFADQRPIASNDDPTGRARNRRVEILVEATAAAQPAANQPTATPAAPKEEAHHG